MAVAVSYEDRITLIKNAAEKLRRRKAWKAKARLAARWSEEVEKPKRKLKNLTESYEGESMIHWTDGSKYLGEHYGDRASGQRNYENDWN